MGSEAEDILGGNMKSPPQEVDKNLGLERLIFFSDAVFAIAITLLVLNIQLPTNAVFPGALSQIGPQIGAYILSFFVIGAFWIAHHRFYQHIIRFDNRLLWLNLLLLLFIAFIPFPTRVVADHDTSHTNTGTTSIVIFYAATVALTGLVMLANWWYAASGHRLVEPDLDADFIKWLYARSLLFPLVFLVSIGVAFVDVLLAKVFWYLAAVALGIALARPLRARRRKMQS
jgi:uncharacterized membrane protein